MNLPGSLVATRNTFGGARSNHELVPFLQGDAFLLYLRADRVLVGHDTADWNGVALGMIRHERNPVRCLGTGFDLADCAFVRRAPDRNSAD
jgi:hypothetical protein